MFGEAWSGLSFIMHVLAMRLNCTCTCQSLKVIIDLNKSRTLPAISVGCLVGQCKELNLCSLNL